MPSFVLGAGLALTGSGLVETLLLAGLRPLTPVAWPGLGMVLAAALGGVRAVAGGAIVLVAYYLLNSVEPQRFPEFYSQLSNTVAWGVGLTLLAAAVVALRSRLRLADALRESEQRLRTITDNLRAAQERLESALDGSNVALWEADLRTGRIYLSEAWAAMVGGQQGETVAGIQELIAMLHPDDVEATLRASVETMKGVRPVYAAEHRVRSHAGEWKWVLSRGRVTERDPRSGRAVRMVGTNVDITDRKRIEEAVQSVWRTDPLTGLANRVLLDDRLKTALARARRSGGAFALLYLDIDRFKQVNDSLGHSAGDTLLKAFATRLLSCVRGTDTVARLGGDEFVVLLEELHGPEDAAAVSRKILETMRAPVRVEDRELAMTVSIGVAHGGGDDDAQTVLSLADAALYEAKAGGRDAVRVAKARATPG